MKDPWKEWTWKVPLAIRITLPIVPGVFCFSLGLRNRRSLKFLRRRPARLQVHSGEAGGGRLLPNGEAAQARGPAGQR